MRLVDDAVSPVKLLQRVFLFDDHLVRRHQHVETARVHVLVLLRLPLFRVAVELKRADHRAPPLELVHPVPQRGLRDDDHVRSRDPSVLAQVSQQRDRLQRLPEAHLVG
eukprot:30871-Pelagococcus_subviridis.AAC.16